MFTTAVQGVRRMMIIFSVFLIGVIFSQGCVSKKAYNTMIDERDACRMEKKLLRALILQQNSGVGVKPLFYYSNIPTHKLRVIYNHS